MMGERAVGRSERVCEKGKTNAWGKASERTRGQGSVPRGGGREGGRVRQRKKVSLTDPIRVRLQAPCLWCSFAMATLFYSFAMHRTQGFSCSYCTLGLQCPQREFRPGVKMTRKATSLDSFRAALSAIIDFTRYYRGLCEETEQRTDIISRPLTALLLWIFRKCTHPR
jgi:hypothetical protein